MMFQTLALVVLVEWEALEKLVSEAILKDLEDSALNEQKKFSDKLLETILVLVLEEEAKNQVNLTNLKTTEEKETSLMT